MSAGKTVFILRYLDFDDQRIEGVYSSAEIAREAAMKLAESEADGPGLQFEICEWAVMDEPITKSDGRSLEKRSTIVIPDKYSN
jgi:hypothetical protein